jgi:hypothetical protein
MTGRPCSTLTKNLPAFSLVESRREAPDDPVVFDPEEYREELAVLA